MVSSRCAARATELHSGKPAAGIVVNELVAEAGKRYNGNPYLDSVDISSVGYWGEGWSPYMPAFPHQKALIDIWFDAFPNTTLLMNFDEQQALTYGTSRGAGWRRRSSAMVGRRMAVTD